MAGAPAELAARLGRRERAGRVLPRANVLGGDVVVVDRAVDEAQVGADVARARAERPRFCSCVMTLMLLQRITVVSSEVSSTKAPSRCIASRLLARRTSAVLRLERRSTAGYCALENAWMKAPGATI